MPALEPLLARLDRATGLRVICGGGGNTCTQDLARVEVSGHAISDQDGPWSGSAVGRARLDALLWDVGRTEPHGDGERPWSERALARTPPDALAGADRVLCMLDGWAERTDEQGKRHLSLSRHAAKRAAKAPAMVRLGILDPEQLEARRRPRGRLTDRQMRRHTSVFHRPVALGGDGILVDCPRCGRTNLLTPSALRVTPSG